MTRCSEQSGLAETVITATGWIAGLVADDQMVGELDVDGDGRLAQAPGDLDVGGTWGRVAAGWTQMTVVAASRMAERNTSLGWTRLPVAVPELTSTHLINRFLRLRQRTQSFSTARPVTID